MYNDVASCCEGSGTVVGRLKQASCTCHSPRRATFCPFRTAALLDGLAVLMLCELELGVQSLVRSSGGTPWDSRSARVVAARPPDDAFAPVSMENKSATKFVQ